MNMISVNNFATMYQPTKSIYYHYPRSKCVQQSKSKKQSNTGTKATGDKKLCKPGESRKISTFV